MEWDGEQFSPTRPAPSPKIRVDVTLMPAAYERFGVKWTGSRKHAFQSHTSEGTTDTGCQTSTAGLDFLDEIGCPSTYLIPTSHRIVGITADSLGIVGAALLKFQVGGKVSRQMVYISKNVRGLYLSETALKQLGIIKKDFPSPARRSGNESMSAENSCCFCCTDEGAQHCLERGPTPEVPDKIPFEPTTANIPKLEAYLLDVFKNSAFNVCTHQPLQGMTGKPMKAVVKNPGVNHPAAYTPIPVAHHWKEKVKADLDRDVRLGIIEKVPQGEIAEWCSRMVVTPKSNGKPRRTIDFQELNRATLREVHHTPSPINLVTKVPAGKLKTVLDAWNGYHSLLLDPKSKKFTNFITEWGMYRYRRGPQGFHGTGDAYTRRFDDITRDEVRYIRCVDDGLLYDDDIESSFWHTFHHIKLCADNGIVFNPEKFKFARECVEFAGFEVTMDGYRPADHIIAAIRDFPTPKDKVDIRSWFGLVNQVAYTFSESSVMEPFRELMKKNVTFYWDEQLDRLFQVSKDEIIRQSIEGVKAYDLQKPTCLATDWCKTGMGFSLMQRHCLCPGTPDPNCGAGHWKLVFAGSKTTNESQQRYSPTEGECLAAVYGLKRCRMYTLGCPNLTLATDHNPLTGILNDRRLDTIDNSRLLELKEKTLPFHFRIVHVPGGSHAMRAADALSRHAVDAEEDTITVDVEKAVCALAASLPPCAGTLSWDRVNDAASMDPECLSLVQLIANGFPKAKSDLPDHLKVYWAMKEDLYVIGNVPHKNRKMLIPHDLRNAALEGLHAGHQGVTSMLSNARSRFFWPGLDASVRQLRAQCQQCNEEAPSQPEEPLILTPPPEMPFEQTASDLFSLEGHTFLAYADRFSGWVEVERLQSNALRHVRAAFL